MADKIGEQLRAARETRHLSFDQVSEATRIRPYYLQALEKDDYSAIPSSAQARGFLRIYASYLNLNLDELLSAARQELQAPEPASNVTPAPEAPAAPAQPLTATQAVEKPHPGLLNSLLERLTRRPAVPSQESTLVTDQSANPPGSEPKPVASIPAPVPPVVVKESPIAPQAQLASTPQPAAAPVVEKEKTLTKKSSTTKRETPEQDTKKRTATSSKGKKTAARARKSAEEAVSTELPDEKKKMME